PAAWHGPRGRRAGGGQPRRRHPGSDHRPRPAARQPGHPAGRRLRTVRREPVAGGGRRRRGPPGRRHPAWHPAGRHGQPEPAPGPSGHGAWRARGFGGDLRAGRRARRRRRRRPARDRPRRRCVMDDWLNPGGGEWFAWFTVGDWAESTITWLTDTFRPLFEVIREFYGTAFDGLETALTYPPALVMIVLLAALG